MTAIVLVVDDDRAIREALDRGLRLEGFEVDTAPGGREALESIANRRPDVVLLDVMMPEVDGVTVTRMLRAEGNDVPVCMLSARDEVEARVAGLQAGADDYVVKPFALSEIVARLHALLRRHAAVPTSTVAELVAGDLRLDPASRTVHRGDRLVDLTRREFELLEVLMRNVGVVVSRVQLLDQVWGYDFEVESNVVDVFVSYIRRKLEAEGEPRVVHTVRGIGFVLRSG